MQGFGFALLDGGGRVWDLRVYSLWVGALRFRILGSASCPGFGFRV